MNWSPPGPIGMAIRTCGQYQSDQRILLVGDGNLSFTLALARAFGTGVNLTATTLDDERELQNHYPDVVDTISSLRGYGARMFHGVDATKLEDYEDVLGLPDLIVFNFPHPGWPREYPASSCINEDFEVMIERHRALLHGFFLSAHRIAQRAAASLLEVHVTTKTAQNGHDRWSVVALGEACGFERVGTWSFDATPFRQHGYRHKRGVHKQSRSWKINRSFPIRVAVTHEFRALLAF